MDSPTKKYAIMTFGAFAVLAIGAYLYKKTGSVIKLNSSRLSEVDID